MTEEDEQGRKVFRKEKTVEGTRKEKQRDEASRLDPEKSVSH